MGGAISIRRLWKVFGPKPERIVDAAEAAAQWVEDNPDVVAEWTG